MREKTKRVIFSNFELFFFFPEPSEHVVGLGFVLHGLDGLLGRGLHGLHGLLGLVLDVTHSMDDVLDGLAALVGVRVDRVGEQALHVADERQVLHGDLRLLPQQGLVRVLRVHRVRELLLDADHIVQGDVARAQRELLVVAVDVRVLAGVADRVAADHLVKPVGYAPLGDEQAVRRDGVVLDAALDHVDSDHARIQRVRVLVDLRADHIVPRMVEYVL